MKKKKTLTQVKTNDDKIKKQDDHKDTNNKQKNNTETIGMKTKRRIRIIIIIIITRIRNDLVGPEAVVTHVDEQLRAFVARPSGPPRRRKRLVRERVARELPHGRRGIARLVLVLSSFS